MSYKLVDLLVDPGPLSAESGSGFDEAKDRLSKRTGGALRLLSLGPTALLADLGPGSGNRGLALTGPVVLGEGDRAIHLWVCLGLARPAVNLQLAPILARISGDLPDPSSSQPIDDAMISKILSDNMISDPVLVEHAVTPLSYRIYPDTPVSEVVELMLRRGVHSVPVVGKELEVLGVLTGGDVLPHTLPGDTAPAEPLMARDVMTRSVLCLSEEESLLEASRAMVSRGVAQLPVVREGQLIGFLERSTVMRAYAEHVEVSAKPGG